MNDTRVPWAGLTSMYPSQTTTGYYTGAAVQLNDYYMLAMTTTWRKNTAIHELGHVLGLDEADNTSYIL